MNPSNDLQNALADLISAATRVSKALAESSGSSLALLAQPEAVMSDVGPKLVLTKQELATLLDVHPRTLDRMRAAGEGPKSIKVGGALRYRRRDVDRWLEGKRS